MIWRNNIFPEGKAAAVRQYKVKGLLVVFGAPKASRLHTSEELAKMGLVGVYVVEVGREA